jgi:phosphomethylpyrimidine synthase
MKQTEQQEILKQRGVLSPDEIHKLAAKTRGKVGADEGSKAACHSDYIGSEESARAVQNAQ